MVIRKLLSKVDFLRRGETTEFENWVEMTRAQR